MKPRRISRHDAEHLLKRKKTWKNECNQESDITWLKRRVQSLQRKTSNALTARLISDEEEKTEGSL